MCVNLHDERHEAVSLGMIRVCGSMPAVTALDLVDERLMQYGLSRERHIVGLVTDGASVMAKLGRLTGVEHQQCHSHGIHLAVTDVLYARKDASVQQADDDPLEDELEDDEHDECLDDEVSMDGNEEEEDGVENEEEENDRVDEAEEQEEIWILNENIGPLIKKSP